MVAYVPPAGPWGVAYLLGDFQESARFEQIARWLMRYYLKAGRLAIVMSAASISLVSWRTRRWSAYEMCLLVYCIFLVLAPGFGVQYLIAPVPLLLTVSISRAWLYSITAGLFLLFMYWSSLVTPRLPLLTLFQPPPAPPGAGVPFGLIAWWVLLLTTVTLAFRPPPPSLRRAADPQPPADPRPDL
jgi:hypothetical protein